MQVVTTLRAFLSNSPEVACSLSCLAQLSRPTACLAWALRPTASMKGGVFVAFIAVLTRDGEHGPWSRWHQTLNAKHNLQASLTVNSVQLSRLTGRVRQLKDEQTKTSASIRFLSRTHMVLETSIYSSFNNLTR